MVHARARFSRETHEQHEGPPGLQAVLIGDQRSHSQRSIIDAQAAMVGQGAGTFRLEGRAGALLGGHPEGAR